MKVDFDYLKFAQENIPSPLNQDISGEHVQHVANMLQRLNEYLTNGSPRPGDFIYHIAQYDFYTALKHADHINKICISVYGVWMYNFAKPKEPMRPQSEIQVAHDQLVSAIELQETKEVNILDQKGLDRLHAAVDALCWTLRHDHSCDFKNNLKLVVDKMEELGFKLGKKNE